jgi:fumarate reductase subunit D
MTGIHRKKRNPLNWLLFCAGMAVGMAMFATFFLAIVLLDKM